MAPLKLLQLPEPLLGFGYQQRMEHPKDGLFLFGPLEDGAHPAEMRIGVIGTAAGIGHFKTWARRIRGHIPSANHDAAHHASWPGFQAVFDTRWPERPITEITVDASALANAIRIENRHEAISKAVAIFEEPIRRYLRQEEAPPTMWFVVIPEDVHRFGRPKSIVPRGERVKGDARLSRRAGKFVLEMGSLFAEEVEAAEIYRLELNFHHQLKAKLLDQKAVIQIVRETTLDPESFVDDKGRALRATQDPATIAWNLCTTAFFKSSGKPWRLADVRPGVCYVGLVFKKDDTALGGANACCGAQMFLDSGDGVVFRGAVGPWYSEADKSFHLTQAKAAELMTLIVEAYRDMHGMSPTELFIHGKARFSDDEWAGFSSAVPAETSLVGVRIRPTSELKLMRLGKTAVQRGTAYVVGERLGYLWTKGFIPRLATYPGWEVPNPLLVEIHRGEADLARVMTDVLGLTKINFNACVFADGLPVTLKFADAVGDILTAAPVGNLPLMKEFDAFVGLDVHKESISIAVAGSGRTGEVLALKPIPNTIEAVNQMVHRLGSKYGRLQFAHEAGPCGYSLHRQLERLGEASCVVAPSRIPKQSGDRIKNDTRDAMMLARLSRAGELAPIWVPDGTHEAMRDLVRARQAASFDVRKARQRIQSFLLKHARRYGRKPWGGQHRAWLANQSFDHPAQQIAFASYLAAEGQAVNRRAELDQQIQELVPSWSLSPLVEALQGLRGVAFIIAVSIVAEIGDMSRFVSARHLMAYLGLVPSERSSGATVRPRGITKSGNRFVRSLLLESAWCYRLRAKVGERLRRRGEGIPQIVKDIAWKAQVRLCGRYRRLIAGGKKSQLVTTAIARELVGFIWAIGQRIEPLPPATAGSAA